MQALRVLASPRVWLIIAGMAAVLALMYYAYLAAVASPQENLKDLPIALVNEDEGGVLGGEEVNLGDRVVENVTDPDSPAADTTQVYFFLAFAAAAVLTVTMLLAAAFGPAGIGVGAVLGVILGLVSSGGLAPLEALPGFYRAYADWLPMRYVVDGLRSLLFYDGSLDAARLERGLRDTLWFLGGDGRSEAAGLEDAVWILGAYLAVAAVLGYAISVIQDRVSRRKQPRVEHVAEHTAAAC